MNVTNPATCAAPSSLRPLRRRNQLFQWLLLAASAAMAGPSVASLTVSPGTIANSFSGSLGLTITGLNTPGQRVIVERYFDLDNSSTITAADLLTQRFAVTDGQVTSIGGRRNINVPGDNDGAANSTIQTNLYLTPKDIPARIDGRFIFRVSPDGAGFTPFTATLMVTQDPYAGGSLSGRIMSGATPQSGAIVLITSGTADDFDVSGITKTDASGNYSLKLPAGTYRPVPVKSGFIFDLSAAPAFTVSAGANTAAGDSSLTTASRTVTGKVRDDAASPVSLGGMLVFGAGSSGTFSFSFSNAAGDYTLNTAAGELELGVLEEQCAVAGVLHSGVEADATGGNVSGLHLTLPRPTALIYGTARTPAPAPVPWLSIRGESDTGTELNSASATDADGNYTLGAVIGTWSVDSETPGYLSTGTMVDVENPGINILHDIVIHPITAHLRGIVRDNHNQPVPNLEVFAHDFQGTNSRVLTNASGNFDIPVHGGPGGSAKRWSLQVNQGDSEEPASHISTFAGFDVTDGTDINNITYLVYEVTSHLRGTVRDENDLPVSNVNIFATLPSPGNALTGSSTGGDGSFDVPAFAGSWRFGLSNDQSQALLAQTNLVVTATDGTDVNNLIFHVRHITGTITGKVEDSWHQGLSGLGISATITISGVQFTTSGTTAGGGTYSLPAFSGTWSVNVTGADLIARGFAPTAAQDVFLNAGSATVNFIANTGSGSTYASWQIASFTPAEQANPAISGPSADPDADGIVNLLEYAFDLLPKTADVSGLPVPGATTGSPRYLTLVFRRLKNTIGLSYNVQEATSLTGPWTNVTAGYELVADEPTTELMRAKTLFDAQTKKFLRLQVVQQ